MTDCLRKVSLVLLFLLIGAALLPAVELATAIAEIEVIRGEQRFLYIRGGSEQKIAPGMIVSIYSPVDDEDKPVGRGEVVEVYPKLSKVKIVELNYSISDAGYVIIGALTREEIKQFKVEHYKVVEEKRQKVERAKLEREHWLNRFTILKYNGGDSLFLRPNGRVKLSIGQVGVINDSYSGNGSLSGSGEVEVVRIFQNAVLVRLKGGAYINSLDSVVTFIQDKKEQKAEAEGAKVENWLVSSVRSVKEAEGKLYLNACIESYLFKPFPDSIGYIYNDNMLLERAAVVRFIKQKIEIIELSGVINPHGVLLFEGALNPDSGFVDIDHADIIPPAIGVVKEVERSGSKTYLYLNLSKKNKGYKRGLYGYIYSDPEMTILVGKIKVLEVYTNLSKVELVLEEGQVSQNSVIKVEVDPRRLIKKSD